MTGGCVCSAHAEMILRRRGIGIDLQCLLRTRGDDPPRRDVGDVTDLSAPHTRR